MKDTISQSEANSSLTLTRRQAITGIAAASLLLPALSTSKAEASGIKPNGQIAPPSPRFGVATAQFGEGQVMVIGGKNDGLLSDVYLYDPFDLSYTPIAPLNIARAYHACAVAFDGTVLVLGGHNNGPLASVEIYDAQNDVWNFGPPLQLARFGATAVALDPETILVSGGFNNGPLADSELYSFFSQGG